jgi:hypothetical protein
MFVVRRFGAWRLGVAVLALAAAVGLGTWAAAGAPPAWVAAAIAVVALAATQALRIAPFALQWDGSRWWLAQPPEAAPARGELRVSIDLGRWMLIRFGAELPAGRRWLPVTAAEAGPSWRAWREAIYAARRGTDG